MIPRMRISNKLPERHPVDVKNAPHVVGQYALGLVLRLYVSRNDRRHYLYREWKEKPSVFFDMLVRDEYRPSNTEFQQALNDQFGEYDHIHLYICTWEGNVPSAYMVLSKRDGLWHLRHRKIRPVPETLAREGVIFTFGRMMPLPDEAILREPGMVRHHAGNKAARVLQDEIASSFELRRSLSHIAVQAMLFGGLPRDRMRLYLNPGCVAVEVDYSVGDGTNTPFGCRVISVREGVATPTEKPRLVNHATASPEGLVVPQSPRCVVPQIKGMTRYACRSERYYGTNEDMLLPALIRSRLIPFVGIVRPEGVCLYGLHYDPQERQNHVAEYVSGRALRACAGLPLLRVVKKDPMKPLWAPNHVLARTLAGAIYDPSPSAAARTARWKELAQVFGYFHVHTPAEYVAFFEDMGLPLPDGAAEHIAQRMDACKDDKE